MQRVRILVLMGVLGGVFFLSACTVTVDDAVQVSVGTRHSCLVTTGGAVECWGPDNALVPGGPSDKAVPLPGLESDVTDVAVGWESACAIRDAEVLCWGLNTHGQLGDGTLNPSATPAPVQGLPAGEPIDVQLYYWTACALYGDGAVWCWGEGNLGQIGNGANDDQSLPQEVLLDDQASTLSVGGTFACVTTNGDSVRCWGGGNVGQLGNGAYADSNLPVKVVNLGEVAQLEVGYNHACVLTDDVECWGGNADGQLGDGTTTNSNTPVLATAWATTPESLILGGWRTCGVMSKDEVHCLGRDSSGSMGNGPNQGDSLTPTLMVGTDTGAVASGDSHYANSCMVGVEGDVRCAGAGAQAQLGNGQSTSSEILVNVVR